METLTHDFGIRQIQWGFRNFRYVFSTKQDIEAAHARILPFIHSTPVLRNQSIEKLAECNIHFKCENFQKVGAFKYRGATNAVLYLSEEERANGVATHSSGNHAQALALAARENGLKAWIVMPENAPPIKKQAVLDYGAKVIECEPTLQAREEGLQKVLEETGAIFIHPYNNWNIIAGQATAAKEVIEDIEPLDYMLCPVGGGGLLSGTALACHYWAPETQVIAGEPEGADDACRSFQQGEIVPSLNPQTIADGLLTSLGDKTFSVIKEYVTNILTVSDEEIITAMRLVWERMKIIIEPSSAVPLAAVLKEKERFAGKQVGIILSGGNVDLANLPFQ